MVAPAVAAMIEATRAKPGLEIEVDLEAQTVAMPGSSEGISHRFDIDAYRKKCLLSGLDELGYTLTQLDTIESFERSYK